MRRMSTCSIGLSNNRCWSSSSWRVSAALATSTQLPTSSRCSPTSVRDDNVFYLFFSETTRRTHRLCKPAPLPPFPPGDDLDPPLWNPSLWKIFPNKLSLSLTHTLSLSHTGDIVNLEIVPFGRAITREAPTEKERELNLKAVYLPSGFTVEGSGFRFQV